MRIRNQWYDKYELSLVIESHNQFLDHENNTQNTKVSLNHLSDHLILLNCHLSDDLIIKKFSKQSCDHINTEKVPLDTYYRKKTFETQVTKFWSITHCRICRLIKI